MRIQFSADGQPSSSEGRAFVLAAGLAGLVGLALRSYLLREQVLVDDEWHSMAYVVGKPLSWLVVNFSVPNGYTSIPLNLYQWILLNHAGWSEGWMRMPSMVFGLLCLVLGPILARPLVGSRRAGVLALLLAISPLLVFYSRLVRPYSAVATLCFVGLFFAERWMRSGSLRHGIAFAVCGVAAVYSHLFAAVSVATIGASVLLFSFPWKRGRPPGSRGGPSPWQALAVLSGMGLAGAVLILPALVNSLRTSFLDVAMQGAIPAAGWIRFASLVSGTANPVLVTLFWGFFLIGVADLGRRHARFAAMLVALFPVQVLAMMLVRPHSSHVGIVLVRYGIALVPVSLLLAACGLSACLEAAAKRLSLRPSVLTLLSCVFVLALACAGPLPGVYVAPNIFTNHGVFQHRYGRLDWSHSFVSEFAPPGFPLETAVRAEDVSDFYRELRKRANGRPIVEYPMMVGDHFNPIYYYQRLHRRPVMVGYARDSAAPRALLGGGVYGNTCIDDVLNLVESPRALRFKVVVIMPAYNAEATLRQTVADIDRRIVDQIILVDDASGDRTVSVAKELDLLVHRHERNRGYGGNQKSCYRLALQHGADIVVMVHPDYQYNPKLVPAMAYLIATDVYDVVLGSRILGKGALAGGMPLVKYIANRFLTAFQIIVVREKLSEYHTGFRAFSRKVLESLPLEENSDDFVFDNQMLCQVIAFGFRMGEVSCPTRYFAEASSINLRRSIIYAFGVLAVSLRLALHRMGLRDERLFGEKGRRLS